jgi:hypothetical protein
MEFAKRTELRIRRNGELSLSRTFTWGEPARGSPLLINRYTALLEA